jgi:hypothetical protein
MRACVHAPITPEAQNSWIIREYIFLAIATSSLFFSPFKVCCSSDAVVGGWIESYVQVGNGFNLLLACKRRHEDAYPLSEKK